MTTQTINRLVQAETCHRCPLFNPEQGVYGWCNAFEQMAKSNHERTASCNAEIAASEKVVRLQQSIAQRDYSSSYLESRGYYFDNGITRWEPMHEVDLELESNACVIDDYDPTGCEEF